MTSQTSPQSPNFSDNSDGVAFSYGSVSSTLSNFSPFTSLNVKKGTETSTNKSTDTSGLNIPAIIEQFVTAREQQMLADLNKKIDESFEQTTQKLTTLTESKQSEIKGILEQEKDNLVKIISESESRLQEVKNSVLATIAIFASFFTFISVSINIFSKANIIESIGLLIILWCCIFSFTYTFFLFTFNKWKIVWYWVPFLVSMMCSIGCLYWISANNIQSIAHKQEETKSHPLSQETNTTTGILKDNNDKDNAKH